MLPARRTARAIAPRSSARFSKAPVVTVTARATPGWGIRSLSDNGTIHATVAFAKGDGPVTLHGYSPTPVSVTASGGSVGQVGYDSGSHLFSVSISPGRGSTVPVTLTRR
ncbi:hypothetical protein GCM10023195_20400 [Actinoallomurus liliacearum]|uniref:Uncharacterized protein n=1 Tax=Actinoallomurus liliacearum TaxID=1080073 RepID=A0ABP8TGV8_9ACTN